MIYSVVPEALEGEILEKLATYYADDPNVTVIVDRRHAARRAPAPPAPGENQREVRDRRRPRVPGEMPSLANADD